MVEPLAALPDGEVVLLGAVVLELELLEPPEAVEGELGVVLDAEELESFFDMSADPDAEPDAVPDGVLGVVVAPDEDDAEPDGVVVRETARSPPLSQPVSNPAPSARDTATAKVVSLIVWASVGLG